MLGSAKQSWSYSGPLPGAVASQSLAVRRDFIKKTYGHLAAAIVAFCALEFLLVSQSSPLFESFSVPVMRAMAASQWGWLIVMAVFMFVGHFANKWAQSAVSMKQQYFGLGLYVVAEAIIFMPLLFVARKYYPGVISVAGISTLMLFGALTATVFFMRKDFSFLAPMLGLAGMASMAVIVCSIIFGFQLGLVFSVLMVALCAGYVLYYTSQVLAHYAPTQHVAASLALFSAIALMFWYILRVFMELRER